MFWIIAIASVLGFILSFLGKGKSSKITGALMIICGAVILALIYGPSNWFFGGAAGILYIIGGVFSIKNASIK